MKEKRKEKDTEKGRDQEQGVEEEKGRNRTQLLQQARSRTDTEQLHWLPAFRSRNQRFPDRSLWLDIEVPWPQSPVGGHMTLCGALWSTEENFSCPYTFQRCVQWTYSSKGDTCEPVWSHCVLSLPSVVLFIMVVFVIFLDIGFVSVYLQMLQLQRGKSYESKSHKSTLPQTEGRAHSDFRMLHRFHLLSLGSSNIHL